jgi:predicted nucleic acid-binding protein
MRICIDSCVFVNGLTEADPAALRLLNLVGPDLILVVPRLVVQEVTRNLQTPEQCGASWAYSTKAHCVLGGRPGAACPGGKLCPQGTT